MRMVRKNLSLVSRMFDPETITLTGAEIEAYNALLEMGEYEKQLIIEQTIDQLKSNKVTSSTVTQYLKTLTLPQTIPKLSLVKTNRSTRNRSESLKGIDRDGSQSIKQAISRIEKIGKQTILYFPMSRSGDKYVAVTKVF